MRNSPSTKPSISLDDIVIQKAESMVHYAELSAGDVAKLPILETAKAEDLYYGKYVGIPEDPTVVGLIIPEKITGYMLNKESASDFMLRNSYTVGELMADYYHKPISPQDFSIIQCQVKKPQNMFAYESISESLIAQVGMVDPRDTESLKEFGLRVLGESADLLLSTNQEVFLRLPEVDRADLLESVIRAYMIVGRADLASTLYDRTINSAHFLSSDDLTNSQLLRAKRAIQKEESFYQVENPITSVDCNRKNYVESATSQLNINKEISNEISTALIESQYETARELAEEVFEDRMNKIELIRFLGAVDALKAVDQGRHEEGLTSYLETRLAKESNDPRDYEDNLTSLLNIAIGKDADPAIVLPILGGFKGEVNKSCVQTALVEKFLERDLVDDAVKYAENIEIPQWRPSSIGQVARHQHLSGRPSQDLLINALERAHISENGHRNQVFAGFASPFVLDFRGLIIFGRDICMK